jgi:hypothetical protein
MNKQPTKTRGKISLKKNKILDKIWHPESTLVFKSAKEKLVIGRFEDGELIPLDEEALDLCTKWKMKYDTSLVDEEEVSESDEENTKEEELTKDLESAEEPTKNLEKVETEVEHTKEVDDDEEEEPTKEVDDDEEEEPTKEVDDDEEKEPTKEVDDDEEEEPTKEVDDDEEEEPTEVDDEEEEEPTKVDDEEEKEVEPDIDNTAFDSLLKDMTESSQLFDKNLKTIMCSIKTQSNIKYFAISHSLEETKAKLVISDDALKKMTLECNETKAKLAKIRSALGL